MSEAVMAKKKRPASGLPTLDKPESFEEIDVQESDNKTVAGPSHVEWVTIKVPVSTTDIPPCESLRIKADVRFKTLDQRITHKKLHGGLTDSGSKLQNGTFCSNNSDVYRWIIEQVSDAIRQNV